MANTTNLNLENVNILADTEYAYNQLVSEIIAKINNNNLKIDNIPISMISIAQKGVTNGVASLGNDGIIPSAQLPIDIGSIQRVTDITARNIITNLYDNKLVFVINATGDITVTSGWAMYIYNSTTLAWTKIVDGESLDVQLIWENVANKPTVFPSAMHTHAQIGINAENITNLQNIKVDKITGSRLVSETEVTVFNDKYSKIEVDNKLANKVENITLSGHTENSTVHVLQTDKDNWNSKENTSDLFVDKVNHRVGVGTVNPTSALHIVGTGLKIQDTLILGLASEVNGQIIDYGSNYSQLGGVNPAFSGGYFRIDLRDSNADEFFNVQFIPANGIAATLLRLSRVGNLRITGTIAGSNLTGTNTGDQDLSGLAKITLGTVQPTSGWWFKELN